MPVFGGYCSVLKIFLALALYIFSSTAFASAPIDGWRYVNHPTDKYYISPQAVCNLFPSDSQRSVALVADPDPPYWRCKTTRFSDGYVGYLYMHKQVNGLCSDGSAPINNNSLPLNQRCPTVTPPPESNPCGETVSKKVTYVVSNNGKDIIYNPRADGVKAIDEQGCTLKISETTRCYTLPKSDTPNKAYCTFIGMQTGGRGDNGEPTPVTTAADSDQDRTDVPPAPGSSDGSCPKGTVNAGLSASGIPMCIGQGTDPKNAPPAPPKIETEKNETLPDGSTQNTKTVTTTNADGSKTTTKTVTVTAPTGEKKTNQDKTTSSTPSGAAGKETQPDEKKGDLCKENPNLAICKNSTVTGKCGEIACMGDAIQCATLRAAAAMQCSMQKDEESLKASPLNTKGQAAIDGKDLEGLPGPKTGQVLNIGTIKAEGWMGNGAAFEDVSVSLRGQEIVIPLSKWSSYLLPFRYMLMIIASLVSYRILAGSVLKE